VQVTREVYAQLDALVEKGRRIREEVGGLIIVPEGGTGIASEFVECENVAPASERYCSFSFSERDLERIDRELDHGRHAVPFHTHVDYASDLSSDDVEVFPEWTKVIHGAEGFRVYVWSSDRYEAEELEIAESDSDR
jgi:proteasome lid subunit RPN8/RPN11